RSSQVVHSRAMPAPESNLLRSDRALPLFDPTETIAVAKDAPAAAQFKPWYALVLLTSNSAIVCRHINFANEKMAAGNATASRYTHLKVNAGGSIDMFFWPEELKAKGNWIKTGANEGSYPTFRFYGANEGFFDKSRQ